MCTSFICGSFNNQEEDDFEVLWPSPTTPSRKSRRHRFYCRSRKENKNPYANRGLDKFEALLADLEDMKQKIFTQKGSHYISFVRFVYKNSNDVKPIIVRLRDPRRHDKDHHHKQITYKDTQSSPLPELQASDNHHQNLEPREDVMKGTMIEAQKAQHARPLINHVAEIIRVDQLKRSLKRKFEDWWMPSYNLPLFVIMVMVFLTFFGRSLAIICTSIAWYMIPTIDGTLENTTTKPKKMIKHEHSRKPSDIKGTSSPKAFLSGPINVEQKHKMKKLMSF